jgi:hypothetical protein
LRKDNYCRAQELRQVPLLILSLARACGQQKFGPSVRIAIQSIVEQILIGSLEFVSQIGVLSRLSGQGEWQPAQSRNSDEFRRFATDARKEQTHVTMVFAAAD